MPRGSPWYASPECTKNAGVPVRQTSRRSSCRRCRTCPCRKSPVRPRALRMSSTARTHSPPARSLAPSRSSCACDSAGGLDRGDEAVRMKRYDEARPADRCVRGAGTALEWSALRRVEASGTSTVLSLAFAGDGRYAPTRLDERRHIGVNALMARPRWAAQRVRRHECRCVAVEARIERASKCTTCPSELPVLALASTGAGARQNLFQSAAMHQSGRRSARGPLSERAHTGVPWYIACTPVVLFTLTTPQASLQQRGRVQVVHVARPTDQALLRDRASILRCSLGAPGPSGWC